MLRASAYTYDPGNRRDPFKSLLAAQDRPELKGPRPEGIPGLLIDEIDLTGIFRTAKGYVAQVQAPNKDKSYLLREGDQLYDGDVVSIDAATKSSSSRSSTTRRRSSRSAKWSRSSTRSRA